MKKSLSGFVMAFCLATLLQAQPVLAASDRGGSEGGGNAFRGQLVDMMAEDDITRLKDYQKYVVPVIQDLKQKVPYFGSYFERTLKSLTWYFIRGKLSKVDTKVNGIPMRTEQAAVPIGNEIWIDLNTVEKIKKEDENPRFLGELLVHETALYLADAENDQMRHSATRKFVRMVFKSNPPATEQELASAIENLSPNLSTVTATSIREREEKALALRKKYAATVLKGCRVVDDVRQKAADPNLDSDLLSELAIQAYFAMINAYSDARAEAEYDVKWSFSWDPRDVSSDFYNESLSARDALRQRWERFMRSNLTTEEVRKFLLEDALEGPHCKKYKKEFGNDPSLQDAAQAAADATRALASLSSTSPEAKVASNTSKPGTSMVIGSASPAAQPVSGSASRAY